ncbi:DUF456 domain-containing protein [Pueribacillus theae]|uniref:DUF456 domain-containing protein n=1 Tax=Pueribacillus theae TaxID=2171751 RepID=A0A2U1K3C5_9BACI|nr:DUF456 domain-containing protein [Pueribacillus theae]PWA12040.1 DUF456 domain-containing protein [Pueribacillus theae]
MSVLIWMIITLLFIGSFVGLIFPLIPSILLVWAGFLLYFFGMSREELSAIFWIGMAILTILIFVSDIMANSFFVKKYGGSKWGERVAVIGVIVGSFVMPPFGVFLVPFAAVIITELFLQKDARKAVAIGFATFIGFLSSTLAKFVIQLIMIGWFILEVIF